MARGTVTNGDDPQSPSEIPPVEPATPIRTRRVCSKCSKAAHLAALAANAVRNADLHRALELLDALQAGLGEAGDTVRLRSNKVDS